VRQQQTEPAVHRLHQAGAVQPDHGHAAPLVGRAEEHQGGVGDRLAAGLAAGGRERLGAQARSGKPGSQVAVGRLRDDHDVCALLGQRLAKRVGADEPLHGLGHRDMRPAVVLHDHGQGVGKQRLRYLRRSVLGLDPDRNEGQNARCRIHCAHSTFGSAFLADEPPATAV
jgi:hypothetical protein